MCVQAAINIFVCHFAYTCQCSYSEVALICFMSHINMMQVLNAYNTWQYAGACSCSVVRCTIIIQR